MYIVYTSKVITTNDLCTWSFVVYCYRREPVLCFSLPREAFWTSYGNWSVMGRQSICPAMWVVMNEWMHEWMNEWMNEWCFRPQCWAIRLYWARDNLLICPAMWVVINEWMNEWMNEWCFRLQCWAIRLYWTRGNLLICPAMWVVMNEWMNEWYEWMNV